MWYNYFIDEESGWMGVRDEYSLYGGCDILKGEKWIVNFWIIVFYKDGVYFLSLWFGNFDII